MIVIAAIDDRRGMMFNKRRQSQDRVLREKVMELVKREGSRLWMNQYTEKQFLDCADRELIRVDENFIEKAERGEFCFVENVSTASRALEVERVILFRWNRKYPGDFFFDFDLTGWTMTEEEEFEGSSHEKITMEVYRNENS